jgi:hypothetical protein
MSRPDIEYLQELALRLPPEDEELINRLERTRLTLEFMLAGIRRPMSQRSEQVLGVTAPRAVRGQQRSLSAELLALTLALPQAGERGPQEKMGPENCRRSYPGGGDRLPAGSIIAGHALHRC